MSRWHCSLKNTCNSENCTWVTNTICVPIEETTGFGGSGTTRNMFTRCAGILLFVKSGCSTNLMLQLWKVPLSAVDGAVGCLTCVTIDLGCCAFPRCCLHRARNTSWSGAKNLCTGLTYLWHVPRCLHFGSGPKNLCITLRIFLQGFL